MANLPPETYEVVPVGITRGGVWVEGEHDPVRGEALPVVQGGREIALSVNPLRKGQLFDVATGEQLTQVDVVFPVLHGKYGEDGTVQGLLELAGVPYVGPGVLASACGMDKEYTKKLVSAAGIAITREVVLRAGEELTEEHDTDQGPVDGEVRDEPRGRHRCGAGDHDEHGGGESDEAVAEELSRQEIDRANRGQDDFHDAGGLLLRHACADQAGKGHVDIMTTKVAMKTVKMSTKF